MNESLVRSKGSTLLELVTVIVMIALLLGIVLPALKAARAQEQSVHCKANLGSWGQIWHNYVEDHDGRFVRGNILSDTLTAWFGATYTYWAEKKEILLCPSATERLVDKRGSTKAWGSHKHSHIHFIGKRNSEQPPNESSYGFNAWLYSVPEDLNTMQRRPKVLHLRRDEVQNMTQVPIFLDSMWRGGGPWYGDVSGKSFDPNFENTRPSDFNGQWISYRNEMMHFAISRHSGGVNGVFLDGAVRPIGIKQLWTLQWHKQFNTHGPWTVAGGVQTEDWPEWMRGFKDY